MKKLPENLNNKKILMRVDFNLPISAGKISDSSRIKNILPTIKMLQQKNAKIILLSHFGRPNGKYEPEMSFKNIYPLLQEFLPELEFCTECVGDEVQNKIAGLGQGKILLLENLRFHAGETNNDENFARALAGLGDYFIQDAFSVVHRRAASTSAISNFLPSFAGLALQSELENLEKISGGAAKPKMAIIGGAKISTKLELLNNLIEKVDSLVVGGAMANTFLAAQQIAVGNSLWEKDLIKTAQDILKTAKIKNCKIILPVDAIVATELKQGTPTREIEIASNEIASNAIASNDMILDIGKNTVAEIKAEINKAKSLIWNGPLGAFEIAAFAKGTTEVAKVVASATKSGKLSSIAGGGDTLAALGTSAKDFSFCSTGGGAFLEWLEGKNLPGIENLL